MKTLIINGGTIEDAFALSYIERVKPDCILAADRGMEFCYRNQIKPDVILGDYDSADKPYWKHFDGKAALSGTSISRRRIIPILKLPSEKPWNGIAAKSIYWAAPAQGLTMC